MRSVVRSISRLIIPMLLVLSVPSLAADYYVSPAGIAAIPAEHPRLYDIENRLSSLRDKACLDANGDPISTCTTTEDYDLWYSANINNGSGEAWSFALMYQMTNDPSYAATAITKVLNEIADGFGQLGADERQDYFLNGHHYMRNAAVVYDWCYDEISASDRAAMINYMNQLAYEIWNPNTNPCKSSDGWGQNDPKNNYYYRHVMAAALLGVATYLDNPGDVTFQDCSGAGAGPGGTVPMEFPYDGIVYTDPIEFVQAKLDQQAIPFVLANEEGGGWHEGANYGRATKILLFEILTILRDSGVRNYFEEIDYPRQAMSYHLYEMQPGNINHFTNGDAPRDPQERPNDSDRHLQLLLIDAYPALLESQHAQFWLENFRPQMSERKKKAFSFFYHKQGFPSRDYRTEIPTRTHIPGMQLVNSRSQWGPEGVSVNFISTDRFVDHCHKNQNTFAIYYQGWQTVSGNTWSSSGLNQASQLNNVLTIDGEGQRYGRGTGAVTKYEASADFTYMVGDASDAYYENAGNYGHGNPRMVDICLRELVHVMPNIVVVYDRMTPTSAFVNTDVTYHFQTRYQPTIQGDDVVGTNGSGKIFHRTLLPTSVTINRVEDTQGSYSWWRTDITPTAPVPNHQFLSVMYVADAGVQTMPATTTVSDQNNKMVGVKIDDPAEDKVILFSTHPSGDAPQGDIIYEVGLETKSQHILLGVLASAGYDVVVETRDGREVITVRSGERYRSSDQGVLTFRLESHPVVLARGSEAR